MSETIAAATLILLRDAPGGAPETLMVQRGKQMRFAASRMVFPGGRVDADDHLVAARPDLLTEGLTIDADDLAARVAAIRETIEEVGLAPCVETISDQAVVEAIRVGLHAGEAFSALLAHHGLRLDVHGLHPFSRWMPPDGELARRFDTRFYIARAPEGEATADGTESSHCQWANAAQHLAEHSMIFPTIRNLERLGLSSSTDEAIAFAARYPIDMISPTIIERDGEMWLSIQDGLGYPVTAQLLSEVERDLVFTRPASTLSPG